MDIDAFVARHQGDWQRLDSLSRSARRPSRLPADDLDELLLLYQRVGGQLAQARVVYAGDQPLVTRLTMLVNDAHTALYSERTTNPLRAARITFTQTFPQAVRHIRWFIAAAAALTFVPWAVFQIWLSVSPRAFDVARARGRAPGLHRPPVRGLLLVQAGVAVRHRGVHEQRPGGGARVRARDLRLRADRRAAGLQRGERRHRRRPVHPRRAGGQVLGPHPAPRPARAVRGRRRRGRRSADGVVRDRSRRPPTAGRDRRGGPADGRRAARPGGGVLPRRDDRGLRDRPPWPTSVRRADRRRRVRRVLGRSWSSPGPAASRPGYSRPLAI